MVDAGWWVPAPAFASGGALGRDRVLAGLVFLAEVVLDASICVNILPASTGFPMSRDPICEASQSN